MEYLGSRNELVTVLPPEVKRLRRVNGNVLQFLHEAPKEKKRKTTSNESEAVSNCYDSASELPE